MKKLSFFSESASGAGTNKAEMKNSDKFRK